MITEKRMEKPIEFMEVAGVVILAILLLAGVSPCLGSYGAGSGDGANEANAILIDSVSAYQTLASTSADWAKYFKVTADIDFAAAGDINGFGDRATKKFTGTFDGDGHTISNITIAQNPSTYNSTAMFCDCGAGAIIKDLTVTGATVVGTSLNANKQSYAAILVGEVTHGATISNCIVDGNVTLTHTNGGRYGIVGLIAGANHGIVINCTASGSVSATATAGSYLAVGGVVGHQTGGSPAGQIGRVITCTSTATISNLTADPNAPCWVGGIAGDMQKIGNNVLEVNNCHYSGTIDFSTTITDKDVLIGGVVGYNTGSTIVNSSSGGNIIANSGSTSNIFCVGGICGYDVDAMTDNSFADCNISVNYSGNVAYVGGAFGYTVAKDVISNCYARGSLFDLKENSSTLKFKYGGGFIGSIYQSTVTNCWCAISTFGAGNANIKGFGIYTFILPTGCFWDTTTSGITAVNTGATGKTTAEMQKVSTFADFVVDSDATYDFSPSGLWRMRAGIYPMLNWEGYSYPSDSNSWYKFDDNSPDNFIEDIKSGCYGTSVRDSCDMHVVGEVNDALYFNGTSDYVDMNNTYQSNSLTLSCWVKPDDGQPSSSQVIFSRTVDDGNHFEIYLKDNGVFDANCVVQGVTKNVSLYQNGGQGVSVLADGSGNWVMLTAVLPDCNISGSGNLLIGSSFAGAIDDGRIYYRALTGNEVKELFREVCPNAFPFPADLSGDWQVGFKDFAILANAWQSTTGGLDWDPTCDISAPADGVIDIQDLVILCENWLVDCCN